MRTKRLAIMMTDREYAELKARAVLANESLADYVRIQLGLPKAEQGRPRRDKG